MDLLSASEIARLVAAYGYGAIAVVVGLESMGLPLPGETVLVVAALYAGTTQQLDVGGVVAAAAAGAIVGDNVGYWLGREFGYLLLLRYGPHVGIRAAQVKVGQYLFLRHGGKVVFFGRFVALLRVLAAALAGANRMGWARFIVANAAGGVVWASVFGFGAYLMGDQVRRLSGLAGTVLLIGGIAGFVIAAALIRRHHRHLEAQAELVLSGPLPPPRRRGR
jgi:membrane protein DedA with SNARE-associated domain